MLQVKVENNKIDKALKVWKNKVKETKQNSTIKDRKEYVKPSVKRRDEMIKAKYIQKIKDHEEK